jgi:hypothetical protein
LSHYAEQIRWLRSVAAVLIKMERIAKAKEYDSRNNDNKKRRG